MKPKIDRDELEEIVEETARLEEEERALLEKPEVQQVLRELDLPAERLDEARGVIAARREERSARRRRLVLGGAVALVCAATAGAVAWQVRATDDALARMTVSRATLTFGGRASPEPLPRSANPEIALDVVLARAPQGAGIELSCDWKAPNGEVRYQNRWKTKVVDRDLWPTHCRRAFGAGDPAGSWAVTMKQGSRELATERFRLE